MDEIFDVEFSTAAPLRNPILHGAGFNWFDFLGSGGYYARMDDPKHLYALDTALYPARDDEESWALIFDALTHLRPSFIRFGLPPDGLVDTSGRFSATIDSSPSIHRLKRLNDWAVKNECAIMVDTFVIPRSHEFSNIRRDESWVSASNMAAENNHRYAEEFVGPLLDYLVHDAHCEAVRYFNPVNEPMEYGVFQTPEGDVPEIVHYVDMYREIRKALRARGIGPSRLGLVGLDGEAQNFLSRALNMVAHQVNLADEIDVFSVHFYRLMFDHLLGFAPMSRYVEDTTRQISEYCALVNKPLFACEIGTMYYGWRADDPAGAASVDAQLTIAEGMIRLLNIGLCSFANWSFMNTDDVDGHWATISIEGGKLVKSPYRYHMYGLLTQHVRPGSVVYPLNAKPRHPDPISGRDMPVAVHGTVLKEPSGRRYILLTNNEVRLRQHCRIDLPDELKATAWGVVSTDRARMMEQGADVRPVGTGLDVMLNPFSLTVLSSR